MQHSEEYESLENLADLKDGNAILDLIQHRYEAGKIYTFVGSSLLSINPNKKLEIYDFPTVDQYLNHGPFSDKAHVFSIGNSALTSIRNGSRSETILLSGDSGSGKTTNAFHLMRFLATGGRNKKINCSQINALQVVLNRLVGAKTLKCESSTRCGYSVKFLFKNGVLEGFNVLSVLPLEIGRLALQRNGEKSFSVFYQLCEGLDHDLKEKFGLKDAKQYFYLNQGRNNSNHQAESDKFDEFDAALKTLGFSEHQRHLIYRLLSVVLHLGNIYFRNTMTSDGGDVVEMANEPELKVVSHLLSVDYADLKKLFLTEVEPPRPEDDYSEVPIIRTRSVKSIEKALDIRDSFAKIVYNELFSWILKRVSSFHGTDKFDGCISIIDTFGFERYNTNSFDEFYINSVNEQFHQLFIQKVFKNFQNDYEDEGIACDYTMPHNLNNERVVAMLFYRPCGLIPLLNDESSFPKGSDEAFFQNASINHLDKSIYAKPRTKDRFEFGVKHFAGLTYYAVDGFLHSNKGIKANTTKAVHDLFSTSEDPSLKHWLDTPKSEKNKSTFVADSFSKAIDGLCEDLSKEKMHFIRCVKVNADKTDNKFDALHVGKQMKHLDVQEHYRMSHFGFSYKLNFDEFTTAYRCLLPVEVISYNEPQKIVADILNGQGNRFNLDYAIGSHSVFLKEKLMKQLESAKHELQDASALIIQRNLKKKHARGQFLAKRDAAIKVQSTIRGWLARKHVAHLKEAEQEELRHSEMPRQSPPPLPPVHEESEEEAVGKVVPTAAVQWFELPESVNTIFNSTQTTAPKVKTVTTYLPFDCPVDKPVVESVSIEEFAELYLKNHVLEARRDPILAPFLCKEEEDGFHNSLRIFKLILKYMNDNTLNAGQRSVLAQYIIQQGIDNLDQRDEIYVQLCNQTYNNKNPENARSAWNLLCMAVNSFPPGICIFPMLQDYFGRQPEPLSSLLLEGLLRPLRHSDLNRGRIFAPTVLEQQSFIRRQPMVVQVSLPNQDSINVEVDAWTTAEELASRVLRLRGVTDGEGWGIEFESAQYSGLVSGDDFIFDAISQYDGPHVSADQQSPFIKFKKNNVDTEATSGRNSAMDAETLKQSINVLKSAAKHRMTPDEFANMSVATRIRNMRVPTKYGDVDRFLDEVFDQALPPNDEFTASQLAATIKGGTSHEVYYHPLDRPYGNGYPTPVRQTLPRFHEEPRPERRNAPSGMSSINLSNDEGRDSRLTGHSSRAPSRQLYSAPPRNVYASSAASPRVEQRMPRMYMNEDENLADFYEDSRPPTTNDFRQNSRNGSAVYRAPENGREEHTPPTAQRSRFVGNPSSNIRQIVRRFESPAAERRARTTSSRSKSTPRAFMNGSVDVAVPLPDYEQEESLDLRSPRQFKSPPIRSASSTPKQPRPPPHRFNVPELDEDPRRARMEVSDKLRRNAQHLPPPSVFRETKSPPTLSSRQESPLFSRAEQAAADRHPPRPPVDYQSLSRSKSSSSANNNGIPPNSNGHSNGLSGTIRSNHSNGTHATNGVQKSKSNGHWVYELDADREPEYGRPRSEGPSFAPPMSALSMVSVKTQAVSGSAPATAFATEPWKLTIRREVFYPGERLDDADAIDLVFSQLIADCRKNNPHRIRQFERDRINYLLNKHSVPVELLDRSHEIPTSVKNEVINEARKWPLYFCRMYPVIQEKDEARVFMIMGISENGIRLMIRNVDNLDDPMVPQGHFDFPSIGEVVYEPMVTIKIITKQQTVTTLTCKQARQATEFISRFLDATPKQKAFVTATVDYQIKEPNLLSFRSGDLIQIVKETKNSVPPSSGNWLYGKIGNRFGYFPAEYVQLTKPESDDYGSEVYSPPSIQNSIYAPHQPQKTNGALLYGSVPNRGNENLYSNWEDQSAIYGVPMADRLMMAEFATKYFRQPKGSDFGSFTLSRRKRDWTWQEINDRIKFSEKPINHSLLRLKDGESDRVAVDVFACIMRFMSDSSMKRGQTLPDCVFEILTACHNNPILIDEVYCQIIKQTTSNTSAKADSLLLGWRLFTILTAFFSASEVLQPYLLKYLKDVANDPRRPFNGTASICLINYQQTVQYGGRKFILSGAEVEALTGGKNVKRQVYELPGGHKKFISTKTITVAEEIVKELCVEMNVLSEAEKQEFALCYILEKDSSLRVLNNDKYILDITSELESRNEQFTLILTRTVWIHPVREDNQLYIDVLFFQVVPNYMAGLMTTLPAAVNAPLPAKTLDDASTMAALLYLASSTSPESLTEASVPALIPRNVFERSRLPISNWLARIIHKMSLLPSSYGKDRARLEFLKAVEKWSLYGSSFYFVAKCKLPEKTHNRPVLAVGKSGIKILRQESMEVVWSCLLADVRSSRKYTTNTSSFLDVQIAPENSTKEPMNLTIETDSGSEIARVIGQYVYLKKQRPHVFVNSR